MGIDRPKAAALPRAAGSGGSLQVKVILHRNHLGLSLWRGNRLLAGVCCLVYPSGSNRPVSYPAFHVALDWRTRMWSWFAGPSAGGPALKPRE
jgi:hypothetical protein